jgi:peptide/nickel transport system permease protein
VSTSLPRFIVRRLLGSLVFVWLVAVSAFTLTRLAPGDASSELFLSGANATTIQQARERLGLNRSLAAAVGDWAAGMLRLDLGQSSRFGRPVSGLVLERAGRTAELAAVALLLATVIGLPLGLLTGARPRGPAALVITPISLLLLACPPMVGALALLLLAVSTGWLSVAPGALVVPALALGLPVAAMLERLQAQATSEALSAPDLLAAAARGLPRRRLLWIHVGRQSLRPVLGIYGLVIGSLFSGSLAVEVITSWPGLGRLMFDALVSRDLFLVAGCALVGAALIALGNLIADVLRAAADPRVRLEA